MIGADSVSKNKRNKYEIIEEVTEEVIEEVIEDIFDETEVCVDIDVDAIVDLDKPIYKIIPNSNKVMVGDKVFYLDTIAHDGMTDKSIECHLRTF